MEVRRVQSLTAQVRRYVGGLGDRGLWAEHAEPGTAGVHRGVAAVSDLHGGRKHLPGGVGDGVVSLDRCEDSAGDGIHDGFLGVRFYDVLENGF